MAGGTARRSDARVRGERWPWGWVGQRADQTRACEASGGRGGGRGSARRRGAAHGEEGRVRGEEVAAAAA